MFNSETSGSIIDTVVFDFDGTIADTFYKFIEIINRNPKKFGVDGIDPTEIPRLRNLSIRYILKEFNLSILKVPSLLLEVQKELNKEITTVKPFTGIFDVIVELKKENYTLGILSSNTLENVNMFLDFYSMNVFDFIVSEKNLFGKHKILEKIISKKNISKSNVVYIGDEVRDVIAAKKAGISSIAVTWGYNGEDILKNAQPTFIVSHPTSILDIINSNR